jgi:hypothetical protein
VSTEHIVSLLIQERDRLEAAIAALQGESSASPELAIAPVLVDAPESVIPDAEPAPAPKKKRKLSAAGRRRIVEATKARWARINAAKAAVAAPAVATTKAAPTGSVAVKKKVSRKDAAYRTMMSERMKAAWAKRKKAVKK